MNSFHKAIRKVRTNPAFIFHEVQTNEEYGHTTVEFKKPYGSVYSSDVPECAWATSCKLDRNGLTESYYLRLIFE